VRGNQIMLGLSHFGRSHKIQRFMEVSLPATQNLKGARDDITCDKTTCHDLNFLVSDDEQNLHMTCIFD